MNRNIINNMELKLGIYPKSRYTSSTPSSSFIELKFRDKPLFRSRSGVNKTLYSLMQESSFNNSVQIVLDNPSIRKVDASDGVTQVDYYTMQTLSGVDYKNDYIYRLYYYDGIIDEPIFTGQCDYLSSVNNEIRMTLTTRLMSLKEASGLETKTDLAGWNQNIQFKDSVDVLLEDSGVDYKGDYDNVDYLSSTNEVLPDLRKFNNSFHVGRFNDEEVLISNLSSFTPGQYGTKYNFINDTVENFSLENIMHFSFYDKFGNLYYVVEKPEETNERIGEYAKLYLQKNNSSILDYIGMGRIPENIGVSQNWYQKVRTIKNIYVLDKNTTSDLVYFNDCYSYKYGGGANEGGFIGQVAEYEGYYIPIFGDSGSFSPSLYDSSSSQQPTLYGSGMQYAGSEDQGSIFSADVNTIGYDYRRDNITDYTSVSRKNESIKSRSYFCYDGINNRLIFQRASTQAPNGSSYDIGVVLEKSWDSFGLNPIGYFDLDTNTLGYLNIENDYFITDWVYYSGQIYASTMRAYFMDYTIDSTTKVFDISRIDSNSGAITIIDAFTIGNGVLGYGLHVYNDFLTFIFGEASNYYYVKYDAAQSSFTLEDLGSVETVKTVTGSVIFNSVPTLMLFKNNSLVQVDTDNQANNIEYVQIISTVDKLGGYLIKSINTEDFTGKIEDSVLTFSEQLRTNLLDLTDKFKLSALLELSNSANKFLYVDNTDTLVFVNKGNMFIDTLTIDNIVSVRALDIAGYKTLDVSSYEVDNSDLFNYNTTDNDYVGDVVGRWYGLDASFTVTITILSSTQLKYSIASNGVLETAETTITIPNWSDITISKTDGDIKISFTEINSQTPLTPNTDKVYTLVFNSKTLIKTKVSTTATDTTLKADKTKKVNNRFVRGALAKLLVNDSKDYFLADKMNLEVITSDVLNNLNMASKAVLVYNKNQINSEFYIMSSELMNNGTTKLLLKEI